MKILINALLKLLATRKILIFLLKKKFLYVSFPLMKKERRESEKKEGKSHAV